MLAHRMFAPGCRHMLIAISDGVTWVSPLPSLHRVAALVAPPLPGDGHGRGRKRWRGPWESAGTIPTTRRGVEGYPVVVRDRVGSRMAPACRRMPRGVRRGWAERH